MKNDLAKQISKEQEKEILLRRFTPISWEELIDYINMYRKAQKCYISKWYV